MKSRIFTIVTLVILICGLKISQPAEASGAAAPFIEKISPSKGYQGDTFTLTGSGFDPIADNNTVYIGGTFMPKGFYSVSDDGKILNFVLTTEVHFTIGKAYDVYVTNPQGTSNSVKLTIISSVHLLKVYPRVATVGSLVILNGSGFGSQTGTVLLYKDSRFISLAQVTSWSDKEIKITIPVVSTRQIYLIEVSTTGINGGLSYTSNSIPILVR